MRVRPRFILLLCSLTSVGCGGCGQKSTDQLIRNLKAPNEREQIIAVRLLPLRKGEATKIIPALIEALGDKSDGVRTSAAIGLGSFGENAKDAVPALENAARDPDVRVREAAEFALSRIDSRFLAPSPSRSAQGK